MHAASVSRPVKRRWKRRIGVTLIALGCALILDYFLYPLLPANTGRALNRGENGLWLRYTWYFGGKTDSELSALAALLKQHEIRYAYPHVRFITKDGHLRFQYPGAGKRLIESLHRQAPEVKVVAWIYAGNRKGEGEVDLARPDVRRNMVREAAWLTQACGFDGVQWDYEICPDGDAGFLSLLRETRAALSPGKILCAAAPAWLPWPLGRWAWSEDYFGEVARSCDQLAVMGYDTGFWLPRSYVWLMRQQVTRVSKAVFRANRSCRILIGVPTYGKGFLSHNPQAENIRLAIKGVREGLADSGAAAEVFAGIAPFADYTTQASEWETYDRLWLQRR